MEHRNGAARLMSAAQARRLVLSETNVTLAFAGKESTKEAMG
jgi:hypothetical protein